MMKKILIAVMSLFAFAVAGEYDNLFDEMESSSSSDVSSSQKSSSDEKGISFSGEHTLHIAVPVIKEFRKFEGLYRSPWSQNSLSLTAKKGIASFNAGVDANIFLKDNKPEVELLPREIVAKLSPNKFRFALGYQIYSWGSADGINPTDNINSVDYRFDVAGYKIPIFGADITWYPTEKMNLQAVLVPFKGKDVFPDEITKMIPGELYQSPYFSSVDLSATGDMIPTISVKEYSGDVSISMPDKIPSNSLMGGKYSLYLGAIDFSFSYLYDYEKLYSPNITLVKRSFVQDETEFNPMIPDYAKDMLSQNSVWGVEKLTLVKQRVHRIGADFRTNIQSVGLWGEFGYSLFAQSDLLYGIDRSFLSAVLGFDKSFGENQEHYLNFQIVGKYMPHYDTDRFTEYQNLQPNADSLASKSYMENYFARSLSYDLNFQTEQASLGAVAKLNLDFVNGYLKPSLQLGYFYPFEYDPSLERFGDLTGKVDLEYRATDNFKLVAGVEGFYSITKDSGSDKIYNNEINSLGFFNSESRLFLNATYFWGTE